MSYIWTVVYEGAVFREAWISIIGNCHPDLIHCSQVDFSNQRPLAFVLYRVNDNEFIRIAKFNFKK